MANEDDQDESQPGLAVRRWKSVPTLPLAVSQADVIGREHLLIRVMDQDTLSKDDLIDPRGSTSGTSATPSGLVRVVRSRS